MVQALARGRVSSVDEARQVIARSSQLEHYEPREQAAWDVAYQKFETILAAG